MAKGQLSKKIIIDKLLETFEGSFLYNDGKEVRIPIMEEGEIVQVKCTLTAAKVNVEPGSDNAMPTAANVQVADDSVVPSAFATPAETRVEITDEEKANLASLMARLGL